MAAELGYDSAWESKQCDAFQKIARRFTLENGR